MLKLRFQRVGRKHEPSMRLVLTESENSTKSGRFKEILGSYDPRKDTDAVRNADRIKYWLENGAKATGSVHNFLIKHKIIDAKKVNVLPKKTVAKVEAPAEEPKTKPVEAAPEAAETAPEAAEPAAESTEAAPEAEAPVVESTQAE